MRAARLCLIFTLLLVAAAPGAQSPRPGPRTKALVGGTLVDGFAGSGWAVHLNGVRVTDQPRRSALDCQIGSLDVAPFARPGDNVLELRLELAGEGDGLLDPLKLLGDFELREREGGAVLVPPSETARPAPWDEQGYPRFSLHGLAPGQFVAASSPRVDAVGALATGIKLREKLRVTTTGSGMIHWRSPQALAHGRYYVQVSGVDLGGVTDCVPRARGCGQEWSNIRRVIVSGS